MATPPERNRRFALIAGAFVVLLLVVVLASLMSTCNAGEETTEDQVSPPEELGPAPGVE